MTQETKLSEPVQAGLWYQTKAGAIVRMDSEAENERFEANNGKLYYKNGEDYYSNITTHHLIKCLGADPFNKVQTPPLVECLPNTNGITLKITGFGEVVIPNSTPTLHDQVAIAALQGLLESKRYDAIAKNQLAGAAYLQANIDLIKQKYGVTHNAN
jgi:hypothetical protein